ncbi:hypothetical protein M011DRAFT_478535 [Sporormia fimetaria CBS 119925]|uniref:Beta/gamma crystallin 'Greek key' domain-containing protein n=1 Tax=Sporormia fimetaria CBS 119925 TaxID=1340428 RepID=A0A6A6V8V1_9PLEO|nr:hypothetical protein M011DRAFT_478535 [Sporormia fimetaria CBS 119925]
MKLALLAATLFASVASARYFELYENANYGGPFWGEYRNNDGACWDIGEGGRKASSVKEYSGTGACTTFYDKKGCAGGKWVQRGDAPTVPAFLNDNIWSFRNSC